MKRIAAICLLVLALASVAGGDEVNIIPIPGAQSVTPVNVVTCGADPTGVKDSGPAFNACIAKVPGGRVSVPDGKYLISTSINATNLTAGGLVGTMGVNYNINNVIKCNTGAAACLDLTGTNGYTVQGLYFDSLFTTGLSAPSTIGILEARPSTGMQFAQQTVLRDVGSTMASNNAANHGQGSIGLYNYSAEIQAWDHNYFAGDKGSELSATNATVAATSLYASIATGTHSMSQIESTNSTAFAATSTSQEPIFECEGLCANINLHDTYMNDSSTAAGYSFCIRGGTFQRLNWFGRCENNRRLIELTSGGSIQNSNITAFVAATAPSPLPTAIPITAAAVTGTTSSVVTLTLSANPLTAGYVPGMAAPVAGVTPGWLNTGGSVLTTVDSSHVSYQLAAPTATATATGFGTLGPVPAPNFGPIQVDTGSGGAGLCPTFYYDYLQIGDLTQVGGSLMTENGTGCTGPPLSGSTIDFISGGGLQLLQGTGGDLRAQGNVTPNQLNLPNGTQSTHVTFTQGYTQICSGSAQSIPAGGYAVLPCGGNSAATPIPTSTPIMGANYLTHPCLLRNLKIVQVTAANTHTPTYTVTNWNTNVATALTCTVANTGSGCSDVTDIYNPGAATSIYILATNPSSANATGQISYSVDGDCTE